MLFEILWALEGFPAEFASMRFQWNVNSDMRSDVVAFDDCDVTITPSALEVQIICAFASNVAITDMLLLHARVRTGPATHGRRGGLT